MRERQRATTNHPVAFWLALSADHVSPATGLAPTVTLSKDGGAFGAAAGAVSELANGWYVLAGNATDRNTLGSLLLHATGTGADPYDGVYTVVDYDPFDANLGLARLDAAISTRSSHAAADVWAVGTRTLTAFSFAVDLSAAALAAIWDRATSALTTVGSIGKLVVDNLNAAISSRLATAGYTAPPSAATVADSVWEEVVPAAYVSGTAGAALGRITAAALTVISPVAESGDVSVIRGDDYLAANGRALDWSSVDWPTLTGGAILFSVQKDAGTVWTKAGTVTAPTAVRAELTAAETVALGAGTYPFDIQATVGGAVTTLLRGTLTVQEDAR